MEDSFDAGLVTYSTGGGEVVSAAPERRERRHDACYDFLSFLGMAQHLGVDFIPITWHSVLEGAHRGSTAQMQQMAIDLQNAFAFKRLSPERPEQRPRHMPALMAELAVLGHPAVRNHSHLSRLEGICWDVDPGTNDVWPVLVFEKASHGDLMSFMERGPGKALSFAERLCLCGDVAVAIADMHVNSIIHGDIKPHNILLLMSAAGNYTARVSDFGYSTIYADSKSKIEMPGTQYWVAPEWNHRNVTTNPEGAQKMDVFSFGVLCLWLLFYNSLENGNTTADFYTQRRSATDLVAVATQFIKSNEEIEEEERKNLQLFFGRSLQYDPALRNLNAEEIVDLMAPERAQGRHVPKALVAETKALMAPHFEVAKSIEQLYLADYRVRKFIAKCLQKVTQPVLLSSLTEKPTLEVQSLAIELAFCYKIGFGVERNEDELNILLQRIGSRTELLDAKIFGIKKNFDRPIFVDSTYSNLVENGLDFRVDYPEEYRAERQLESAISWFARESTDLTAIFGESSPLALIATTGLFYVWRKAGRWHEAIALRKQITQVMKSTKGESDPDTLASMSQLAAIQIDNGELEDAENLLLQVQSVQASTRTAQHPEVLETTNALAGVYKAKGNYEKAVEILLPALDIRKQLLGPEHPDTLRLISSLAATYLRAHQLDEAEPLLTRLVAIRKVRPGLKHTETLSSMSNLAAVYYHRERFEDAKNLYSQIVDVRTEFFCEEHQETLMALSNLASVNKKCGMLGDAELSELRLITIKTRVFGEDGVSTLTTRGNLALTYAYQERWHEAVTLGLKVVDSKRRVQGGGHSSTLSSILNLAEAHLELYEVEKAKALLTEGMQDAVAAGKMEHFETKEIMSLLLSLE